jgi:hypothetical protein
MDYYNLMKAWTAKSDDDFAIVNSHDKASAVRDSSKRQTLHNSLLERLRNSKNMVLIVGKTTRFDIDWVPFEISSAIDTYKLPIIAAYPGFDYVINPALLYTLWPKALADRINNRTAKVIHIPFKKEPIQAAVDQFTNRNLPSDGMNHYSREAYQRWGLLR